MERISCNSLFKHGPSKCSPNFCVHEVYVCVLYRSMGTGLLRMNIHTLCTLSCTAHTVDTEVGNSVMTTIFPGSLKLAYLASGQIVDD